MLNNGPDTEANEAGGADITQAPFKAMQDIRLAPQFFSAGGGALPMNSGGHSWNLDHVTTTGNVVFDLLHNFHLECGARLHKLRVYETLTEPTGREVCGYLLVRGSVHAHAYALALQQLTGADVTKILPTPNINLDRIPEARKYTATASDSWTVLHSNRRLVLSNKRQFSLNGDRPQATCIRGETDRLLTSKPETRGSLCSILKQL
jgi:Mn-containing catalase